MILLPVTTSATKALRQDRRRALANKPIRSKARTLLKKARLQPTVENVRAAFSALDRAVKKHLLHKNAVSRYKSHLSKQVTAAT